MTASARTEASGQHSQESCSGLLVVQGGENAGATCVGLRSAFRDAVDLAAWHAAERPNVPPGDLLNAACMGRSVYNKNRAGDRDAPPLCIGIEWLRYHHQELAQQQQQQQHAAPRPAEGALPAGALPAGALPAGAALALAFSGEGHAPKPAAAAAAAPRAAPAPAQAPAGGRPGWLQAAAAGARQRGAAVLEEVFGDKDPLWFAKRFADRARTNADAMQRTALQLAAAAMGHLPPEGDADN